ncbi:MAG: putative Ig domain-containing protein [Myxococcota bacterium]
MKRTLPPLLIALSLQGTAWAQPTTIPGTPYLSEDQAHAFTPLSNPTVLSRPSAGGVFSGLFEVPLPFDFRFYGDTVRSVTANVNGALAMDPTTTASFNANAWAPGSSPAFGSDTNGWIAPYWGDVYPNSINGSSVGFQLEGQAPFRTLTFEWLMMAETSSRFSCCDFDLSTQIVLYEGLSGRIDVRWSGTVSNPGGISSFADYTSGMESRQGDEAFEFPSSACSPDCRPDAVFSELSGRERVLRQDPGVELSAGPLSLPEFAPLGAPTPVSVVAENLHRNTLGPFLIRLQASTDRDFDPDEAPVFEVGAESFRLFPFSARSLEVPMRPDASLGTRRYWIRAIVDAENQVPEVDETNNLSRAPRPVRFLPSRPDLEVREVRIDRPVSAPGGEVGVELEIANIGSEPVEEADGVSLSILLSGNPAISPQDAELLRRDVALDAGETRALALTVPLPAVLASGDFFIGAFLDLDDLVEETNEANNGRAAFVPLAIEGGDLAIVTSRLPAARLSEPYTALLSAFGGDGDYRWSLSQGSDPLPPGLGLEPGSGVLFGVCASVQTVNLEVEVRSGGALARRSLSLTCSDPREPLTVVTRRLPDGLLGQEYVFQLLATGGEAGTNPLTWFAEGLPSGLGIQGELISGTPRQPGSFRFTIVVDDGVSQAERMLDLEVRSNPNLLIDPVRLPQAELGAAFEVQLTASGGIPPIVFELDGRLPRGMVLDPGGRLRGVPDEVGRFVFEVVAKDTPPPGSELRAQDRLELELLVADDEDGFFIATPGLPRAVVGEGYSEPIASVGGVEPITWRLDGVLPDGLETAVSNNELQIIGTPLVTDSRNLLVTAQDAIGRTAGRVLVLEVGPNGSGNPVCPDPAFPVLCQPEESSGCAATGFNPGALTGLLLALTALGQRRLRRRRPSRPHD